MMTRTRGPNTKYARLTNAASAALAVAAAATAGVTAAGCATGFKPCSQGGDTSANFTGAFIDPKEIGNAYCAQKKIDGTFVNHGRYQLYSKTGVLLAEGEFQEGRKEGTWIQYDLKGQKIAERIFIKGVDKTPTPRAENFDPNRDSRPRFSDQTGVFAEPRNRGAYDSSERSRSYPTQGGTRRSGQRE